MKKISPLSPTIAAFSLVCLPQFAQFAVAAPEMQEQEEQVQEFDEEALRVLLTEFEWDAQLISPVEDESSEGKLWFAPLKEGEEVASANSKEVFVELQNWELSRNDGGEVILTLGFLEIGNPRLEDLDEADQQYSMKFVLFNEKEDGSLEFEVDVEHEIDEIAQHDEGYFDDEESYLAYIESITGMVLEISPAKKR